MGGRMAARVASKVDRSLSKHLPAGETIDYFVCHSWEDNWVAGDDEGEAGMMGMEKTMTLLAVSAKFEKIYGRKPRFWISKFCDSGSTAHEIKHMPLIMSSCDRVLLFYSDTFTTRLWCLYELYIIMALNQAKTANFCDRVDVVNLGSTRVEAMQVPQIYQRTYRLANCTNKMDTLKLQALLKMSPGGYLIMLAWFNGLLQDLATANGPKASRRAF